MATIAALAIGAASAIGSSVSASQQADAQADQARMSQAQQERLHEQGRTDRAAISATAKSDQDFARQSLVASEQTKLNLLSSLGQPGTYGPGPGSTSGPIQLGSLKPTGLEAFRLGSGGYGVLSGQQLTASGKSSATPGPFGGSPGGQTWGSTGQVTDPNLVAGEIKGTSGFRTVSKMVAEAEQLMNRTGPLWDQLNNSVVGSVYEANAGFQRDAMEQLARSMARGGTARRQGLQMAQAFQIQEKTNRQRTSQLWQAKLSIEKYRTEYAQDVTTYAANWVNNHAGIRDRYQAGLTDLQTMWSQTLAPTLVGATVGATGNTQQGILSAGQGLSDAINTRGQAIGGALEGSLGAIKTAISNYDSSSAGGQNTTGAFAPGGSQASLAEGGGFFSP